MMQGLSGLGVGGAKASTGFGQWYTDMQDSKEVRLDRARRDSRSLAVGKRAGIALISSRFRTTGLILDVGTAAAAATST